jgi:hypothetical protein
LESSQPPPAFSQLSSSFGSALLGTSFAAAPLNTSFGGAAFTTPRGKGTNPLPTPSSFAAASFISSLSSPTASGNFKEASTTVPNTRTLPDNTTTTTTTIPNTTTALPNTLNAPRDSRAAVVSDEEPDDDEFSNEIRANTSRSRPGLSTGPQISTRPDIFPSTIGGGHGDEDEEEDSHFNELYGNRTRRIVRTSDRPEPVPVDKEMEFYQEMHAGGSNASGAGGSRSRARPHDGTGGESQASGTGTPGDGPQGRPRTKTARRGGIAGRGGRSQKLQRASGPTLANLMGVPGIETSVSYGAAAAASPQVAPVGPAGISAVPGEGERPRGRTDRVAGGITSRGRRGDGEVSRGRDAGGVGPHRNTRRRASPVGMSAHPYAFTNLTPSTNVTSRGNTNDNADANANANTSGNIPENTSTTSAGPATQVWRRVLGVLRDVDDDNDDDDVPSRANRSPRRVHPYRRRNDGGTADGDGRAGAGGAANEVTDDEENARQMAAARRKEKWRREVEERRVQRLSGKGLGRFFFFLFLPP